MLKRLESIDRSLKATNEKLNSINTKVDSMQSDIRRFCGGDNIWCVDDIYKELTRIEDYVQDIKFEVED